MNMPTLARVAHGVCDAVMEANIAGTLVKIKPKPSVPNESPGPYRYSRMFVAQESGRSPSMTAVRGLRVAVESAATPCATLCELRGRAPRNARPERAVHQEPGSGNRRRRDKGVGTDGGGARGWEHVMAHTARSTGFIRA